MGELKGIPREGTWKRMAERDGKAAAENSEKKEGEGDKMRKKK